MHQSFFNEFFTCIYPLHVTVSEPVHANDSGNGWNVYVPDVQLRPRRVQYPARGLHLTVLGLHVPGQHDRRDPL